MADSGYTVQETAAYFAAQLERIADDQQREQRLNIRERIFFDSIRTFLERIARDDLGVFAAVVCGVGAER